MSKAMTDTKTARTGVSVWRLSNVVRDQYLGLATQPKQEIWKEDRPVVRPLSNPNLVLTDGIQPKHVSRKNRSGADPGCPEPSPGYFQ